MMCVYTEERVSASLPKLVNILRTERKLDHAALLEVSIHRFNPAPDIQRQVTNIISDAYISCRQTASLLTGIVKMYWEFRRVISVVDFFLVQVEKAGERENHCNMQITLN